MVAYLKFPLKDTPLSRSIIIFLKKETDKESLLLKHNIDTVLIPAANTKIKVSKWEQIFFQYKEK